MYTFSFAELLKYRDNQITLPGKVSYFYGGPGLSASVQQSRWSQQACGSRRRLASSVLSLCGYASATQVRGGVTDSQHSLTTACCHFLELR